MHAKQLLRSIFHVGVLDLFRLLAFVYRQT